MDSKPYSFMLLPKRTFHFETESDIKNSLMKWSMKGRLLGQSYGFDQPFQLYQKEKFFYDFFHDRQALYALNYLTKNGDRSTLQAEDIGQIEIDPLNVNVLSLEFFDRLTNNAVVRPSGHICQCFSETYEKLEISDEVRKMLVIDDSDYYSMFDETERKEFLFRIFMHLSLGGELCQQEETIQPLLDTAKAIYKDCVSVAKDQSNNRIHIVSNVFQITLYDKEGNIMYPCDENHIQNFCYAAVDPVKRHLTLLYHRFGIGELPKAG